MHVSEKIDQMVSLGLTFNADYCGESCNIFYPNMPEKYQKAKFYGDGIVLRKGSHLNKMVIEDVKKRVANGDYTITEFDEDHSINVVYYCPDNIEKIFDKKCYAVDINSCYWTTAYNLGVISESMYDYGLKDDVPKTVRNSSIGSLGAYTRHIEVEKGNVIVDETKRRPNYSARFDIINTVWNVAMEVQKELGEDMLMFLTDCFFITEKGLNKLDVILSKYNYDFKMEDVIFTGMQKDKSGFTYVEWVAFKDDAHLKMLSFNEHQSINKILSDE